MREGAGLCGQVHARERMPAVWAMARERGMSLPLLLKPLPACCLPGAHDFVLIESQADSADIAQDSVVQQFIPHNSTIHKVFVIGRQVRTCSKIFRPACELLAVSNAVLWLCLPRKIAGPIQDVLFFGAGAC